MVSYKKSFALLLLSVLLLTPGIHKLMGAFPPDWFIQKFSGSLFDAFPHALTVCYGIITSIELVGGILLIRAFTQELMQQSPTWVRNYGILAAYKLFVILALGNLVVQDYDGAFQDVMYFVGVAIIDQVLLYGQEPVK